MKKILFVLTLLVSVQSGIAYSCSWVINGHHKIEKLGVNQAQINIAISGRNIGCYVDPSHPNYKIIASLLHTLYVTGKNAFFRCSENSRSYSALDGDVAVYELIEVIGETN